MYTTEHTVNWRVGKYQGMFLDNQLNHVLHSGLDLFLVEELRKESINTAITWLNNNISTRHYAQQYPESPPKACGAEYRRRIGNCNNIYTKEMEIYLRLSVKYWHRKLTKTQHAVALLTFQFWGRKRFANNIMERIMHHAENCFSNCGVCEEKWAQIEWDIPVPTTHSEVDCPNVPSSILSSLDSLNSPIDDDYVYYDIEYDAEN